MGKIAFVFSGQGAQYTGMGKELYECSPAAKAVFDMADSIRQGTSTQCFEADKETLSITVNTQPCVFTADLAAAAAVAEKEIKPDYLAGFSLGEIKQFDNTYPVNYNSPAQTVVATTKENADKLVEAVKAEKGKGIKLAVSGAFHSPFMRSAAEGLGEYLADKELEKPVIPIYSNVTAQPYGDDIKQLIKSQAESPVQWQKTVENLIAEGVDTFIEVGVGKTLAGLIKKINKDVRVFNVENRETLDALNI